MLKNLYIIGCGLVGSVIGREFAEAGYSVKIVERRHHIGGNLYDYVDEYGILVHKYGPHVFHTNNVRVWNYFTKYCEMIDFDLVCGAVINGICVPTSFGFESVDKFFPEDAKTIKNRMRKAFKGRKSATILELLASEDEYIKRFANFLYENDYLPYTAKQWGIPPEKLDNKIFNRVPFLFSYESRYFNDRYQGIPKYGYTNFFNKLLNHKNITLSFNIDALKDVSIVDDSIFIENQKYNGLVINTGPIDELFKCKLGKLPYRSLSFEWRHDNIDSFQNMPVVAYPQENGYTRITEYKKLPPQDVDGTSYALEFPKPYSQNSDNEPYYPIINIESEQLYYKYNELAGKITNLICCGRLADFKYYNMDAALERALNVVDSIL